jgi:hypothetical protein
MNTAATSIANADHIKAIIARDLVDLPFMNAKVWNFALG